MRLDKFLKVSRLIKRRTLAKEIADQGRILVNGNHAKAATTLQEGDELQIQFGQRLLTIEINRLKETVKKDEASDLYTIKDEQLLGNNS
ncbi:putative ribosomal RNA-binding heat shock protein [Gracilibacillus halophilus YIM-C55.5]|uniref:RQC P-site tRNA stabilizing factor n=1 Tax=Gracilibacillus halophilus YIM-C55.5 TaxID=1308866 RepID=N4WEG3_9BACI|nr:RNA-binding S4 domain-containing protein [Gracilibacillus halophilus]ENH97629.1 putative ribosomal RNA-binding heat shock protein [Gracilibacillus halophilus YIM-C55.5]